MSAKMFIFVTALAVVFVSGTSTALGGITIPTVPVGNAGNAADTNGRGAVAYTYNIGATEVTNAQYTAFLNAVAATDPNGLYNTLMSSSFGGISRSGSSGSFTYATISGRENHPVNYVSFWDATRFANWLHNGQPTGAQTAATTEGGAYTLTANGISGNTITRNAGWNWAVASLDEWYKAAYHQPAAQGGDSDNYWLYPNSTNSPLTAAQANISGSGFNAVRDVGSYAASFYGAFDMGGNAVEWNEQIMFGSTRNQRGGSFFNSESATRADNVGGGAFPTMESRETGFRVAQIPAPSSVALIVISAVVATRRRR